MANRDPDRINRLLPMLGDYWRAHPELRLGQLLGTLTGVQDTFYLEDHVLEDALEKALRAMNKKP